MNNASPVEQKPPAPGQIRMNRIVYGVFTAAGIIFALVKDWNNAMIFLGLAPVFDPFLPLPFKERPKWQQAWLYVHVAITLVVLVMTILGILY